MSVWYSSGCGLGSCGHRRRGGLGTSGHRAEELARAFDWSHLQSNQPTAEVSVVLSQVLTVPENLCWPSVVSVSLCCRALRRFCCVLELVLLWLSLWASDAEGALRRVSRFCEDNVSNNG